MQTSKGDLDMFMKNHIAVSDDSCVDTMEALKALYIRQKSMDQITKDPFLINLIFGVSHKHQV